MFRGWTVPGGVPATAVPTCVKPRARARAHALLKPPVIPTKRRGALARRASEVSTSSGRDLSRHTACSLLGMYGDTHARARARKKIPGRVCAFEPFVRIPNTIFTASLCIGCYWIVTWNVTVAVWPLLLKRGDPGAVDRVAARSEAAGIGSEGGTGIQAGLRRTSADVRIGEGDGVGLVHEVTGRDHGLNAVRQRDAGGGQSCPCSRQ